MKANEPILAAVIDKLAQVNAQIKVLEEEAKALKDSLASNGPGSYESLDYKAVVSKIDDSVSVNYKKVAEYLQAKVSAQVYGIAIKKASGVKNGYVKVALYDL